MIDLGGRSRLFRRPASDHRAGKPRGPTKRHGFIENAMMCPSMMALSVALVPGDVSAKDVRFGHGMTLAIALLIAVLGRLVFDIV